jgi:hypothetical protein
LNHDEVLSELKIMYCWPWPIPALVAWLGGWAAVWLTLRLGVPPAWALLAGVMPSLLAVGKAPPGWRRIAVLVGLPLSLALVHGMTAVPPWAWLVAGAALLLIYPMQAWRDAPLFPTPPDALSGLAQVVKLPEGARVLDAGSGLGDGLRALARVWPRAQLHGVEGGWVMALLSRLRVPSAVIRRGDFWASSWADFDLVYLFQRPESMPRAWAKACTEMQAGTWLVSLEFEVPGVAPTHCLNCPDGRPLWVYRVPVRRQMQQGDSITRPSGR